MASNKRQKPKETKDRSNPSGFTKAGPNSRSGGKNRHAARKAAMRRTATDKNILEEARDSKLESKLALQLNFRLSQAELAKDHIYTLQAGSLAEKVARLIIESFPSVEVDKTAGKSRVQRATDEAMTQLTYHELLREAAIKVGVNCAKRALNRAYDELTKPSDNSHTSELSEDSQGVTPELVNA